MTNVEAIKSLKRLFSTYELDLPCTDSLDVLHKSIEALEKQIPKAPIETQELIDIEWLCPVCKNTVRDCVNVDSYCKKCGQKILF